MKLSLLILIAMMGWGQEMTTGLETPKMLTQPAPLKCGKYQHVEYESCPDMSRLLNFATGEWSCSITPPSHCFDDLHIVTEREWQAMLKQIELLIKLNDNQQKQIDIIVKWKR